MLDLLITLVRIPIGIIAILFQIVVVLIIGFILETIAVVLFFPFAVLTPRRQLKQSWFATYPNSIRKFDWDVFNRIFKWMINDI